MLKFDRPLERFVTPGMEISLFLVPWDTEILGFPVAQIDRISVFVSEDTDDCMRQLRSWLDEHQIRLVVCRLASRKLHESMLLEAHGFRFVEMVYYPRLAPIVAPVEAEDELAIEEAGERDLPCIETIAGTAFATGRYKLDWRIDPTASDRRYRIWVRNSFSDPRHKVLTASLADNIVGFFVVEEGPNRSMHWHLTAVAPAFQGLGLGKRIWRAMVTRHYEAGITKIETTISAHNSAVMNIYAALGFRFGSPYMTFHWVRD